MMDLKTGEISNTAFDDFMVLGHELVHAWRVDNGMYLQYADEGGPADAAYRYGMARQEELQTTGLFYNAPEHSDPQSMHGTITENGFRLENPDMERQGDGSKVFTRRLGDGSKVLEKTNKNF